MKDKFHKLLEEVQNRKASRLKQLKEAERQSKDLTKQLAKLGLDLAEAKRLLAENEKFEAEMRRQEAEELRKKPGAKRKWKGALGYQLICAVKALTADGISVAEATRNLYWPKEHGRCARHGRKTQLLQQMEKEPSWIRTKQVAKHWPALWEELLSWHDARKLAARYHDALSVWGSYFQQDRKLDTEMERFRAMSNATTPAPGVTRIGEK
jgi:hypothetical protein